MRLLDVTGYLAAIEDCRERYNDLRILSRAEIGESHMFGASAAALVGQGRFRPGARLRCTPYRSAGG